MSRLRYPLWRCDQCGRIITRREIVGKWEAAEATSGPVTLCPCGCSIIHPTNPKMWEEMFLPRVWRQALDDVKVYA